MAKPVPEEEKAYSCPYCGAKFKTSEGLVRHLKRCDAKPDTEEEEEEPIASGAGGIPLYSTSAQKTRTPKEPDEDEDEDGDEDEDEDDNDNEYACPECDYSAKRPFRKCPKCGTKLEWD